MKLGLVGSSLLLTSDFFGDFSLLIMISSLF